MFKGKTSLKFCLFVLMVLDINVWAFGSTCVICPLCIAKRGIPLNLLVTSCEISSIYPELVAITIAAILYFWASSGEITLICLIGDNFPCFLSDESIMHVMLSFGTKVDRTNPWWHAPHIATEWYLSNIIFISDSILFLVDFMKSMFSRVIFLTMQWIQSLLIMEHDTISNPFFLRRNLNVSSV